MLRRILVVLFAAAAVGAAPGVASAATFPGQAVVHLPSFGEAGTLLVA